MHHIPHHPLRHASRRGFTLIELLTVIAIIGILAAILIPTVGAVRAKAKTIKCVNQLRTWGQATRLMANDNKGYIPLTLNLALTGVAEGTGQGKLYSPYLGSATVSGNELGLTQTMDSMDYYSTCPALDRSDDTTVQGSGTRRSYAFIKPNGAKRLNGGRMFGRTDITVDYYNVSDASTPTRLILMLESKHPSTAGAFDCTSLSSFKTAISTNVTPIMVKTLPDIDVRHNGIVNVLFLDGSVRGLPRTDLDPSVMRATEVAAKTSAFYNLK